MKLASFFFIFFFLNFQIIFREREKKKYLERLWYVKELFLGGKFVSGTDQEFGSDGSSNYLLNLQWKTLHFQCMTHIYLLTYVYITIECKWIGLVSINNLQLGRLNVNILAFDQIEKLSLINFSIFTFQFNDFNFDNWSSYFKNHYSFPKGALTLVFRCGGHRFDSRFFIR